jgi:hypothetical protein
VWIGSLSVGIADFWLASLDGSKEAAPAAGLKATDYIAIAAVALSVIALLSSLILTWLKWPRIAVEVDHRVRVSATFHGQGTLTAQVAVIGDQADDSVANSNDDASTANLADQAPVRGQAKMAGDTFALTVINNGSEAITVRTIGFEGTDAGGRPLRLDYLDTWRSPNQVPLPKIRGGSEDAVFPARIEGHDCEIYEYSDDALVELPIGIRYTGYAERYKSFRLWPKRKRSTVRKAVSESTVFRNGPQ